MGVMLFVIVALAAGLEWSRRRQAGPQEAGAGRSGVQDRDLERLRAELRVLAGRES
ncbi:hypothetical protein GCM10009554_36290 [Kribbella koreensis]|uniref:Uncharacterized protein n=2 Tax=Kribbella TaxID=182639 RepID=A0ABP6XWH4_9ACTN